MKRQTYILLAVLVLLVLSLVGCRPPALDDPETDADKVVEVTANNYSFSPNVIVVETGQKVRIELISIQGTHDWVVDEFDAATPIVAAGAKNSVEFVADQSGEFEFYCSVANHRELGMAGTLIVEDLVIP